MRMLMNNLDPEVAEHPDQLIVYGGSGRAARSWDAYAAIIATLKDLSDDETMLVQSGKPVGVLRTHEWAPRVLIANSNLVPQWATWEEFRRLEQLGLTMYGQMTAGSWIYIGTQGILQGTYETFAAVAAKRFGGSLAGTITLTAGLGGMGGAQPLAVTMNGGVVICVECDQSRITRRIEHGYLDEQADNIDDADPQGRRREEQEPTPIHWPARQRRRRVPGPAQEQRPHRHRHRPDLGPRSPDLPAKRHRLRGHGRAPGRGPGGLHQKAPASRWPPTSPPWSASSTPGAEVFDYGNSIRGEAQLAGYDRAFDFPGFVPAYIRPLFCEGKGPFRWAALSGDPKDIAVTDQAILDLFPQNEALARWMRLAREKVHFQGLPARICWLGYGERHLAGLRFNDLVKSGDLSAPIVLGRDHLDCGSVASPYRETEAMADGSDAIADWPLLNALVNTASGASWVSIHHGGGVGIGRSIHAGQVCVADGTELAGQQARAGPHQRPGDGRDQAHRRRLRTGRRRRRPARRPHPDGGRMSFAELWRELEPLGRDPATGGYRRYSWTPADAACRAWFIRQAEELGLTVEPDNNGNLWAWWDSGSAERANAIVTGSHLDSVPDGGGYDGALGVVSALAAVEELKVKNFNPERALAIAVLTEEEGARFRVPCLGSRLMTGAIDPDAARALSDDDGVTLAAAMTAAGGDASLLGPREDLLGRHRRVRRTARRAGPRARPAGRRPSASPRASGRTAGGGSTSPAAPTTREPPGSPTARTRCCPTPEPCSRLATPPRTTERWPRSAR